MDPRKRAEELRAFERKMLAGRKTASFHVAEIELAGYEATKRVMLRLQSIGKRALRKNRDRNQSKELRKEIRHTESVARKVCVQFAEQLIFTLLKRWVEESLETTADTESDKPGDRLPEEPQKGAVSDPDSGENSHTAGPKEGPLEDSPDP